jgi:hypothetical protein
MDQLDGLILSHTSTNTNPVAPALSALLRQGFAEWLFLRLIPRCGSCLALQRITCFFAEHSTIDLAGPVLLNSYQQYIASMARPGALMLLLAAVRMLQPAQQCACAGMLLFAIGADIAS